LKLIKGNEVINATEKAYRDVYPGPISFTYAITIGDKDLTSGGVIE